MFSPSAPNPSSAKFDFKSSVEAFRYINNPMNRLNKNNKHLYFSAFEILKKDPKYWDLLELNEDDQRLLENRNALEAYCNYVIATHPKEHYRYKMISELLGKRLVEKILSEGFADLPSPGWWIPTIDLIARIKMKVKKHEDPAMVVLSSGKVAKLSELKFTILDDKNVTFRRPSELEVMCSAINCSTPITLVSFRPHLIALHEAQKIIITSIKLLPEDVKKEVPLDHEESLTRIVDLVMAHAKDEIDRESRNLISSRERLTVEVSQVYDLIKKGQTPDNTKIATEVKRWITEVEKNSSSIDPAVARDVVIALTIDMFYKKAAEEVMNSIIKKSIEELIAQGKVFPLEIPVCPILFMVAGGQASGKSKSVLEFKLLADKECGGWGNVYKGGGDCLRSQVLKYAGIKDMNPELFAQLTQSQVGYVSHTLVAGTIKKMSDEKKSPHMFIEQVYVGQDKLKLVESHGKALVTVVSTEVLGPNGAVTRAFERGKSCGRFENAKNILGYHKGSTAQLPDRILDCKGKDVYMKVVDNNGDFSEPPVLVVEINCKDLTIIIHNKEMLERFIKKTALNPDARCPEEAYDPKLLESATIDNYFSKLKDVYDIRYSKKDPTPVIRLES